MIYTEIKLSIIDLDTFDYLSKFLVTNLNSQIQKFLAEWEDAPLENIVSNREIFAGIRFPLSTKLIGAKRELQ